MGVSGQEIETSVPTFLKATIAGGLLFLLPLVIVAILLDHAMKLAGKVVQPISEFLTLETVLGTGGEKFLAVLLLVLISLVAGLFARTNVGKAIMHWFENSFLGGIPQYQLAKGMAEGVAQIESTEGVKPAIISMEGGWQIGYLLEPLENGWVAVFLPQTPTPMSGNVMYLPMNRVRLLKITMKQAMTIVRRIGIGSAEALHACDLTLPQGA